MKLRFLLGAGIGYVLGTRAGREQYDRLTSSLRDLVDSDMARDLRSQISDLTGGTGSAGGTSQPATPPLTAGPGPLGGTDRGAVPGVSVGLDASGDPAAGGGDVVLPDLESSSSAAPVAPSPGEGSARRLDPPNTAG